jgi:D-glycero-alpha-D-manno-heptose-7-phosphate kinase
VSFFGGGTDLASYYETRRGMVLSTSIDKFLYVMVRRQIGIVEHRFRINWSEVEFCDEIDEIRHPIVREALRLLDIDEPVEISTFSDIPSNSGLGSSSAFAVGILHALYALKGEMRSKNALATEAAMLEIDVLGRVMGKQDHFASSYGDFNILYFNQDGSVEIDPVFYDPTIVENLRSRLLLIWTGQKRDASQILKVQNAVTLEKIEVLTQLRDMAPTMKEILMGDRPLDEMGELLHESWMLKRSLTGETSTPEIDDFYDRARCRGAVGGKLCGAGGGGFLMLYVPMDSRSDVISELADAYAMDVGFDRAGTRITYYEPSHVI